MKAYIKMYLWAFKESISFMKGSRDLLFWLKLPFKAHQITMNTLYCECGSKNPCSGDYSHLNKSIL